MQTKTDDWTVKITNRRAAEYKEGLELISFEYVYRGGAPEKLEDVPFLQGTNEPELLAWLTEIPDPTPTMEF